MFRSKNGTISRQTKDDVLLVLLLDGKIENVLLVTEKLTKRLIFALEN